MNFRSLHRNRFLRQCLSPLGLHYSRVASPSYGSLFFFFFFSVLVCGLPLIITPPPPTPHPPPHSPSPPVQSMLLTRGNFRCFLLLLFWYASDILLLLLLFLRVSQRSARAFSSPNRLGFQSRVKTLWQQREQEGYIIIHSNVVIALHT